MARKKVLKKKTGQKKGKGKVTGDEEKKDLQNRPSQVIEVKVIIAEVDVRPRSCKMKFKGLSLNAEQSRRASIWVHEQEKLVLSLSEKEVVTATKIKKLTFEEKKETPVFDQLIFSSVQLQKIADMIKSECVIEMILEPDTQGVFEELYGNVTETTGLVDEDDKQLKLDLGPPTS